MDKNYYEILGLRRDVSDEQIANNYKKMVLRWHPKFAKENQQTSLYHFSQISEAYEVLSDPLKRAFFDKYGWKKLQDGLFQQGELKGGYRFANNPDEIFEKFFQNNNVFSQKVDKRLIQRASIFSNSFGALNYVQQNKNKNLVVTVQCNLTELYCGVSKKVSYQKNILNDDGRTISSKDIEKIIQIKPGFGNESVIKFLGQGHEAINRKKSDLIFKIEEVSHPWFVKKGCDLIYTAKVSLDEAIACEPIQIRTLDNRRLKVSIDEIPNPRTLKQIPNEGMPITGTTRKGSLFIRFDISFPQKLDDSVRKELRKLLA